MSAGSDPVTGKRRQRSKTVHGTKADAIAVLNALTAEVRGQYAAGDSSTTVGQLVAEYLRVTDLTATYRADCERVVAWLPERLARTPVWKVRPNDLDNLYAALRAAGRSPHRIGRLHDVLSASLGRAVDWGWATRNPATGTRPPTRPRRLIRVPTPEVLAELLERAGPDFATYLMVSFVTGARRGEMVGLQWGDVDGTRLWFRRSVSYTPATGVTVKPTKTERERVVTIDERTAGILAGHRADMSVQLLVPIGPETFVFPADWTGTRPWRPDFATYRFVKLRDELGLAGVRLHDLRHAAATYALRAGYEVTVVSKRLGHSNPRVTLDVYSHVLDGRDAEVATSLGEVLHPRRGSLDAPLA